MTCTKKQLRLGPTAIAAVLALSSTPLLAQPAEAPPVATLPTPAAPVVAQPAPAAPTVQRIQPIPAMEPVVNVPEAAETRVTPARRATTAPAVTRARPVSRAATPTAIAPAPAAEPAIEAPVAPTAEAPFVEPVVPMAAEPVSAPVESAASEGGTDLLPIAGGAAALLALAGGAYALSRRRREDEAEPVEAETWESDHVAPAVPASAAHAAPEPVVSEPIASPVPAVAAAAAVPAGMDLSRYGRHVQAAYAGPTPDNPSLSLKRRLKRAAFFDQRERTGHEGVNVAEPAGAPVLAQTARAPAPKRPATITSRRVSPNSSTQALFGFRPAFQN